MVSPAFRVEHHTIEGGHIRQNPQSTLSNQNEPLRLAIKQYIPLSRGTHKDDGVTIIAAGACGFPIETYEPLWAELIKNSETQGFRVRSIWFAAMANHGQSGLINAPNLGSDHGWDDHTRDLLHMINHFHDQMPRPILGIGHSMGATQLVNLSLIHPRLFTTIVSMEPIMTLLGSTPPALDQPSMVLGSFFRRDKWPSRDEAIASFRANPAYTKFEPRVFDVFVEYALLDIPSPTSHTTIASDTAKIKPADASAVTLTTPVLQEVSSYFRYKPIGISHTGAAARLHYPDIDPDTPDHLPAYRPEAARTLKNLPYLRPSTCYLFGSASLWSTPSARTEKLELTGVGIGGSGGVAEGRVEEKIAEGAGHFLPFERVEWTGRTLGEWLGKEMRKWQEDEREVEEMLQRQRAGEVDRAWKEALTPYFVRKKKKTHGGKL